MECKLLHILQLHLSEDDMSRYLDISSSDFLFIAARERPAQRHHNIDDYDITQKFFEKICHKYCIPVSLYQKTITNHKENAS